MPSSGHVNSKILYMVAKTSRLNRWIDYCFPALRSSSSNSFSCLDQLTRDINISKELQERSNGPTGFCRAKKKDIPLLTRFSRRTIG